MTIGRDSCKNVTLVCQLHSDRSYPVLIVIILVKHGDMMILNMMVNVDGHQLLTATGHPLHHLLVGHQGQLGPSQVHVPPGGDGGDDDRDNYVPPSDDDEKGNDGEVDDDLVTIS